MSVWRPILLVPLASVCIALSAPRPAGASCDVLPSAALAFRSALGSADRPFARPGDWVTIALDARCHAAAPGFTAGSAEHLVTVVFRAPSGRRNAVVLADDCPALAPALAACDDAGLEVIGCRTARHTIQDPLGGVIEIRDIEKLDTRQLRFRFPDSDTLLGAADDDLTFAGPAAVAVTPVGDPLPCGLATDPCAAVTGTLACIDVLFADDGSCGATPDPTFPAFTALPPPNDYQAVCEPVPQGPTSPCQGGVDEIRFTIDAAGNLLIPVDWRGVLFQRDLVPVLRLVQATSPLEAYPGRGAPIRIPDLRVLKSYSPGGKALPPLFDPLTDPSTSGPVTFFGSADAPETILRIARHERAIGQCDAGPDVGLPCLADAQCPAGACGPPRCAGGTNAGAPCAADAECPDGECGPGLFDFTTRFALGAGPVLLRKGACVGGANDLGVCADDGECPGGQCGRFDLTALDPVPLDGLAQTEELNAFVREESLEDRDLNGDGDAEDHVVTMGDRRTGQARGIGTGGADGIAITRIHQPPFSYPALALEDDVLAFLLPEPLEGAQDLNGNGAIFETLVRVRKLDGTDVTAAHPDLAADAAPVVNGRPLVVSGGKVYFRGFEPGRARQATERITVGPSGEPPNDSLDLWRRQVLSADGRYLVAKGPASNLVPDDTNGVEDVFVYDWRTRTAVRASVGRDGQEGDGRSEEAVITPDGRYVGFTSLATNYGFPYDVNSPADPFVRDLVLGTTEPVCQNAAGQPNNDRCQAEGFSGDGRFVVLVTWATNLLPSPFPGVLQTYVRDRLSGGITRISVSSSGEPAEVFAAGGAISADGRYAIFETASTNIVEDDTNGPGVDVFLRDRTAGVTTLANLDSNGVQANPSGQGAYISANGRYVVFETSAALTAGDTNGTLDVYLRDLVTGTTTRVSVSSSGRQLQGRVGSVLAGAPMISADGRRIVFASNARTLVAGTANNVGGVFVHDPLTRLTHQAAIRPDGTPAVTGAIWPYVISEDGRYVTAMIYDADFFADDTSAPREPFLRGPDATDCASDLTDDCDQADTVLQVLDVATGGLTTLCPATQVAVAGGRTAFLRPEGAGDPPGCPALPLSDADAAGAEVVHLWDGSEVQNLGRPATWVGLSETLVAALVPEAREGAGSRNGDSDTDDTVLQVYRGGAWTSLAQAADAAEVVGPLVAFLTPEAAQGNVSLNGDGDAADRVLQVYDAAAAMPVRNTTQAAEEMVAGTGGLVAFRTREAAQGDGGTDLNGDGDTADTVLQVYDASDGLVHASGQAVTPCRLEACDPRLPYKVGDDTVTFLTFEGDQGRDLNADGDERDLVLQVLNVRQACHEGTPARACHTLAATTAGVCTTDGAACVSDADCAGGLCFVPPGGCIRDTGQPCALGVPADCPLLGQFCQPLVGQPGRGVCQTVEGTCQTDANCEAGARCNLDHVRFNRIVSPFVGGEGGAVFTGAGRCVERLGTGCATTADCEPGETCDGGACRREHGACAASADCPPGSECVPEATLQTAADGDGDELPDAVDNCPGVANILQEDTDADGRGDACDAETCGNGTREGAELCDGTDASGCALGCTALCRCAEAPTTTTTSSTSTTVAPTVPTSTTLSTNTTTSSTTSTTAPPLGVVTVAPVVTGKRLVAVACALREPATSGRCAAVGTLGDDPKRAVTKRVAKRVGAGGRVVLKVRLTRAGRKLLRERGRLEVQLAVELTDAAGRRDVVLRTVVFERRR